MDTGKRKRIALAAGLFFLALLAGLFLTGKAVRQEYENTARQMAALTRQAPEEEAVFAGILTGKTVEDSGDAVKAGRHLHLHPGVGAGQLCHDRSGRRRPGDPGGGTAQDLPEILPGQGGSGTKGGGLRRGPLPYQADPGRAGRNGVREERKNRREQVCDHPAERIRFLTKLLSFLLPFCKLPAVCSVQKQRSRHKEEAYNEGDFRDKRSGKILRLR